MANFQFRPLPLPEVSDSDATTADHGDAPHANPLPAQASAAIGPIPGVAIPADATHAATSRGAAGIEAQAAHQGFARTFTETARDHRRGARIMERARAIAAATMPTTGEARLDR
jgi:hypothetical protein